MNAVAPPVFSTAAKQTLPARAELAVTADARLVTLALDGSENALQVLADRYRSRIYAFALASLRNRDDAEDVAQEALVRAFAALGTCRHREQFRSWLFRIAANLCRDRRRRAKVRELPLDAASEAPDAVSAAGSQQEQVVLRTVIFAALSQLAPLYREPVALHYMEGFSIGETAAILGRSGTAVRMQLWRARGKLAAALEDWDEDLRDPEVPEERR